MTEINVAKGNTVYATANGVLLSKDKTSLLLFPKGRTGSYTIPGFVTNIDTAAFFGCNLTEVIIPNSITSIRKQAFWNSSGLSSVYIPNSVERIEKGAFFLCPKVTIKCEANAKPLGWADNWLNGTYNFGVDKYGDPHGSITSNSGTAIWGVDYGQ
jgi:hypothetical protein